MSQSKGYNETFKRICAMSEDELDSELVELGINIKESMTRYDRMIKDAQEKVRNAMLVPKQLL